MTYKSLTLGKHILNIITCISVILISLQGCKKDSYHIKGDLHQVNVSKVYLIHVNPVVNSYTVLDSSEVHEGHFSFKGSVEYPIACNIKIGRKTTINLIVENSDINVTGSIQIPEEIKVTGSSSDKEYHDLLHMSESIASLKNKIWANMLEKNTEKTKSELNDQFVSIDDSLLLATKKYVEDNPKSIGAAYFLYYLYLDRQMDINKLAPIIKLFDCSIKDSEYLKYLNDEICLNTPLIVGEQGPSFSIQSIKSDSIISNTLFNGKYLYIDFSASWLKTGSKRNSILKKVLTAHSDSLDILTVYLDTNRKVLEDYRLKNDINWKQACSFMYWEDEMTKFYGVTRIPYGILLSPNGTIVAINPKLTELEQIIQ